MFLKEKMKKGSTLRAFQPLGVYDTGCILSYFFLSVILSASTCVFAKNSFYADTQRGYFWFETPSVFDHDLDPFDPSKKETPTLKDEMAWSDSKYKTARDALKAFQDELEEKKAHFVLKPTTDSALSYLKIQKAMLEQTSKVAHVYKKALMMTQKEHATSSYVVGRLKDNERRLENEKKLTLSSRFFDILFVYKKGCPYCEKFKDILLRFQKTFGYHVDALSIGGGHYKDFHTIRTHPLEKLTSFEMVPAVFLVSKTKDIAAPISQGYLPYDSLKERIVFILDEIEKGQ